MKHSNYSVKLGKRKSAGAVHYQLPVDARGEATLNPKDMVKTPDGIRRRSFTRLRRADEC